MISQLLNDRNKFRPLNVKFTIISLIYNFFKGFLLKKISRSNRDLTFKPFHFKFKMWNLSRNTLFWYKYMNFRIMLYNFQTNFCKKSSIKFFLSSSLFKILISITFSLCVSRKKFIFKILTLLGLLFLNLFLCMFNKNIIVLALSKI